jgi:hypothetical protein
MKPTTVITSLLLALAAAVPPLSAVSQPLPPLATPQDAPGPAYNIELIVFRATAPQGGAENWSVEEAAPTGDSVAGAESTSGSSQQVGHFVGVVPTAQFQLTEIENRLRASGGYVPVAHVAWSQTASAWGTRAGFPVQRLGIDVPGLSGNVFLERGQYLHLGMTLSYAVPAPPAGLGAAPGTTFTLNQSRRIRFYERNYFDHPAFGVIALVTPAQGARPPGR